MILFDFSFAIAAASVANVQAAIEHIFPLVYEFRKRRTPEMVAEMKKDPVEPEELIETIDVDDVETVAVAGDKNVEAKKGVKRKYPFGFASNDPHEDNMIVSDDDEDDD